jgi:peptidoglycan/LPS O-acetylase OafA/YrhL
MSQTTSPIGLPRLPALDAVRAIGAAAVLGTHVGFATGTTFRGFWGGFLARLDVGVAIFFVLSGFLLIRPFLHAAASGTARPGITRYLRRRAVRILPAYWLALAACFTLLPQNANAPAGDWVRYATLTQIYEPGWNRHGLSQTWSLATEVAFYVALPVVVIAAIGGRWRPWRALSIVAIAGLVPTTGWLAGMATGRLDTTVHTSWLPTYAVWFAAGMALAVIHVAIRTGTAPARWSAVDDLAAAPLACWVVALGLYAVASTPLTGPRDLYLLTTGQLTARVVLFAGVAVMVLMAAAFGPPTRLKTWLGSTPARWLGDVSYGLFLWHLFVLEAIYLLTGRPVFTGDFLSIYALTAAGGLVLATTSYYVLERPLMRWSAGGARRTRKREERALASTAVASGRLLSEHDREPQAGDGQQAQELWPGVRVAVSDG